MSDRAILRKLAAEYAEYAFHPVQAERKKLHAAVNDLKMSRPVVLIDEIPWNEMNWNGELTLQCEDPYLREVEQQLRRDIFQQKYFPADNIVRPYFAVRKIIESTGIGVTINENQKTFEPGNEVVSHEYEDQFPEDDDLQKLVMPHITYNKEETMRRYHMVGDIFSDILPVKVTGENCFFVTTWDDIAMYRGVTPLLMDLVLRPEFMEALAEKITRIYLETLRQYEELGLFDNDPLDLHCTAIATNDLPKPEHGEPCTRKHIWGRGAAQVFSSVGKEMHEEFDIRFMKETIGSCGLSYYGCCEPLDKKLDIVEKIPNLRKISITPWADVNAAAEIIQNRYVMASKPNPANIARPSLDCACVKQELETIANACARNRVSFDLVLKDISTCCHNPQNIVEWEKIAMSVVGG